MDKKVFILRNLNKKRIQNYPHILTYEGNPFIFFTKKRGNRCWLRPIYIFNKLFGTTNHEKKKNKSEPEEYDLSIFIHQTQ